ncbi:MAG: hypothetical protein ACOY3Y_16015 [Acidobacteriota bacterium]
MRAVIALVLLAAPAFAERGPQIHARFAAGSLPGTVRYQVIVTGAARDDARAALGLPTNLRVLAGPLIAREVSWQAGVASAQMVFTWVLTAPHPGPIAIGPTTVELGDVKLVSAGVSGKAFVGDRETTHIAAPSLHLEVSRRRVVAGETLVATVTLDQPSARGWEVDATFPGSWSEPLPEAQRPPAKSDGRQVLAAWVVIPAEPGALHIPPARARRANTDGAARDGETAEEEMASSPTAVTVDPLPEPPAGYFGAVGDIEVTRRVIPEAWRVGELATLEIEVQGRGNFPLMDQPATSLPDAVRTFPAEDSRQWDAGRDGLSGRRTWRLPLSAAHPGRLHFREATLASFVPGRGFVEHRLPAMEVDVLPAAGPSTGASAPARPGFVPSLGPGRILGGLLALLSLALAATLVVRRARRTARWLPPHSSDPAAELAALELAIDRWSIVRFGVAPEAGEAALASAGCPSDVAVEATALRRELRRARLAPGLADASASLADLRARARHLLAGR